MAMPAAAQKMKKDSTEEMDQQDEGEHHWWGKDLPSNERKQHMIEFPTEFNMAMTLKEALMFP